MFKCLNPREIFWDTTCSCFTKPLSSPSVFLVYLSMPCRKCVKQEKRSSYKKALNLICDRLKKKNPSTDKAVHRAFLLQRFRYSLTSGLWDRPGAETASTCSCVVHFVPLKTTFSEQTIKSKQFSYRNTFDGHLLSICSDIKKDYIGCDSCWINTKHIQV